MYYKGILFLLSDFLVADGSSLCQGGQHGMLVGQVVVQLSIQVSVETGEFSVYSVPCGAIFKLSHFYEV
jgi:hypothetical protein